MKSSTAFVKCLENEGVKYVFAVPGEENLDVLESLRTSSISLVLTRHEQAAGFMAATVGRLTGKPGVALSTLGPGATNFITAAAYAQLGAMPLLIITGQKPIKGGKQGHFQIIKTVEIMHPVTKFTRQVVDGKRIPSLTREAFRIAEEERPGAVHLEIPKDVATEAISEEDARPFEITNVRRPIAEYKAVDRAVDMIQKAKHPLILIGAGANRKLTSNMLAEFIEKTKIPFFNTQMGKGVVDEHHPLFIGTAAFAENDYVHCAISHADLIINVGHDVIEKPPFIMHRRSAPDQQHGENVATVIHINFYSAQVDNVYFPQLEVVGDIANTLWQLKEKITRQQHWDFSYFMRVKQKLEEHIAEKASASDFPLIPQRIVADVQNAMRGNGGESRENIVTLDNGMYKLWFARNFKSPGRNSLLLDNALATMGAGLPSAIAAKLVFPEKKVLAVCGDGGFMMNSQELETTVRLKLPIVVLILKDDGYGMIKWEQHVKGFPEFGLDFGNPDFVMYAESYGAKGLRVTSADDLLQKLNEAFSYDCPVIIECPIDYSENMKQWGKDHQVVCPM